MYKVGDIIATKTYNGAYHLNIIEHIREFEDGGYSLYCKTLYDGKMVNCENDDYNGFSINLPEQENSILPKEEYFKAMQDKINEQQEKLNSIKEEYEI